MCTSSYFILTLHSWHTKLYPHSRSVATSASAEIEFNKTTGDICFTSSLQVQECGLSQLTRYDVLITDITESVIFENNSVPESYCVIVDILQCGPFHVSVHPNSTNNSTVYSSISWKITFG